MGHLLYAEVPKVIRMWKRTSARSRTREREREGASEDRKQRDEALDRRIGVRV
jgi:hypothetical protein